MNGVHAALVSGASGSIGRPVVDGLTRHDAAGGTDRDSRLIADEPSRALADLDAVRAPRQQH